MNQFDIDYQNLLKQVLNEGTSCSSRNLNYLQLFGATLRHDMREGFPQTTLRRLGFGPIQDECLAYLAGSENINEFGRARRFWEYLADENNHLPHSYGKSWRDFDGVDQLQFVLDGLCYDATSRHYVVQTFHPAKRLDSKCPPCTNSMVWSSDGTYLDLLVSWRSSDASVGTVGDFSFYALMLSLFANFADLEPRHLQFSIANLHIYQNNIQHAHELISRTPKPLPQLIICDKPNPLKSGVEVQLNNYQSQPALPPNIN